MSLKNSILSFALLFFAGMIFMTTGCDKQITPYHKPSDSTGTKPDSTSTPPADSTSSDTSVNINRGLVVYLPFNGSLADSSGNNYTETVIGSAGLTIDQHGYANDAFADNGIGYMTLSNNGAYAVDSSFSLSIDFVVNSLNSLQCLASIVDPTTAHGPTFGFGFTQPNYLSNLTFGVNGGPDAGCDLISDHNPGVLADTTSFVPQLGIWYNAIAVFNKGTVSVYVDGRLVGQRSNSTTTALFCSNSQFVVGGWWNSDPQSVNGKIDALRFYNRSLNANEIAWLSRNFQVNSTKQTPGVHTSHAGM